MLNYIKMIHGEYSFNKFFKNVWAWNMDGLNEDCVYISCLDGSVIVFSKSLGTRYIHKEIKLREDMNGIHSIVCKMGLNHIRRRKLKVNTFNDVHLSFGACFKSAYVSLCHSES